MEMMITIIASVFQFTLIGIVFYIIIKYGKLRVNTKINYKYKKTKHKLSVTYRKFNGFECFYFRLKPSQSYILHYDVNVEKGSLTIEWRDRNKSMFSRTLTENDRGSFQFNTAKSSLHSFKIEGDQTSGGCQVEMNRRES